MIDALKRKLGIAAQADDAQAGANGDVEVKMEDLLETNSQLTDQLAGYNERFAAQAAELEAALRELAETKAALTAIQEANAKAAADTLAAKLAARKEAIVAALGTERADAFMAATKDMPDEQFKTVMAAMALNAEAEANKPEFTEVGVDAQADVNALQAEAASNGTAAILKAKYQQPAAK